MELALASPLSLVTGSKLIEILQDWLLAISRY